MEPQQRLCPESAGDGTPWAPGHCQVQVLPRPAKAQPHLHGGVLQVATACNLALHTSPARPHRMHTARLGSSAAGCPAKAPAL